MRVIIFRGSWAIELFYCLVFLDIFLKTLLYLYLLNNIFSNFLIYLLIDCYNILEPSWVGRIKKGSCSWWCSCCAKPCLVRSSGITEGSYDLWTLYSLWKIYTYSLFLSKVSLYLSHRFFMQFVFQHMQQLLRPENDAYSCFVFADAGDIWCFWLLFGECRSKQEKAFVSLLSHWLW